MTTAHTVNPVRAVLANLIRPHLEGRLPDWIAPRWFATREEAWALAPEADIGWFDMYRKDDMAHAVKLATRMQWLNSVYAGLDGLPMDTLLARGVRVTNGAGISAITIAEYVVMGMLTVAKGYREVVLAQSRHEWLTDSPGKLELAGSKALIVGFGAIGQRVAERLLAFGVAVTAVRRRPDGAAASVAAAVPTLGMDEWRPRLGEFDWVILAVPATAQTVQMLGAAEFAAMKTSATLINIARGTVVDQAALTAALKTNTIAAAFLDVTEPEPLPPEHELWTLPNAHITMHLSGRAQTALFPRSAERFLQNLPRYRAGQPLMHQVDLTAGY
jgi:phosphoglycerate dehydrogenase-like enzyme